MSLDISFNINTESNILKVILVVAALFIVLGIFSANPALSVLGGILIVIFIVIIIVAMVQWVLR